jgi:integrase
LIGCGIDWRCFLSKKKQPDSVLTPNEVGRKRFQEWSSQARVEKEIRKPLGKLVRADSRLYLQTEGAPHWFFRYTLRGQRTAAGHPKTVLVSLGPAKDYSLEEVKEKAREGRRMLREGLNPREEWRRRQIATETCSDAWPAFFAVAIEGVSEKYWKDIDHQWRTWIKPVVGDMSPALVTTEHARKVVEPAWLETTKGRPLRGLAERFFDHLTVRGLWPADKPNPFRLKGNLGPLLPRRRKPVEHHAALDWREMPQFMADLRAKPEAIYRLIEAVIESPSRASEFRLAEEDWYDPRSLTITVPARGEKTRGGVRKPIPRRAAEIIDAALQEARESKLIFPAPGRGGKPWHESELTRACQSVWPDRRFTLHGMRSVFRDWCAAHGHDRTIAEMTLGHKVRSATEASYWRDDMLEPRRRLIEQWSKFCSGPPLPESAEVVELRRG